MRFSMKIKILFWKKKKELLPSLADFVPPLETKTPLS